MNINKITVVSPAIKPETMLGKIGQCYKNLDYPEVVCMLSQTSTHKYNLINLETGNRYLDSMDAGEMDIELQNSRWEKLPAGSIVKLEIAK